MSALRKIELAIMSKTEEIANASARVMWQKEVELGFYDERIEAYFKVFNSSQFLFVDGENMISRPWVEVEKIEEFLGVEKIVSKRFSFSAVPKILKFCWVPVATPVPLVPTPAVTSLFISRKIHTSHINKKIILRSQKVSNSMKTRDFIV